MAKSAQRKYLDETCYDAALRRIRAIYDRFDHVAVAFSGGKDSTACLNLCLEVARERGRTPLRAIFYDEECIPPETVEYVERVAALPDVALEWYCIPLEQRNACSASSPSWYPWAPEDRERWARPLPPRALTALPDGADPRKPAVYCNRHWFPASLGSVALVMGIRTQESMTRYRAIATKKDAEFAYLSADEHARHVTKCYPIYDWTTEDVWLAPHAHGWDYNRAYDVMDMAGVPLGEQRCSPAFGEQPLEKLWCFPACWPDLWARMCERVPGASTAMRYAKTELYRGGSMTDAAPGGGSWADACRAGLARWPPAEAAALAGKVKYLCSQHRKYSKDPIPDAVPHPVSGFCWKDIALVALKGNKLNRQCQKAESLALAVRKRRAEAAARGAPKSRVRVPGPRRRKVV